MINIRIIVCLIAFLIIFAPKSGKAKSSNLKNNPQPPANQYEAKLQRAFLYEDFSDGNYTKDPPWVVTEGEFQITKEKKLYSSVPMVQPQSAYSSQKAASIQVLVRICPDFDLKLSFISDSTRGSMEIVLLGGFVPEPRYKLVYQASPSPERQIKIVREKSLKQFPSPQKWQHTIKSTMQCTALDDGEIHLIRWTRDSQGLMRVLVDGIEILETVETYYRNDFDGVALVNLGGTYNWGPIQIIQAAQE